MICAFCTVYCAVHPTIIKCFDVVALKVIFRYFDDQHSMSVTDLSDSHVIDAAACSGQSYFRPLDIFNDMEKTVFGPKIDASSVSSYPTTHGYYVKCKVSDIKNGFYEKLSSFNPRTRLMFNLIDGDVEVGKAILKMGFDKFKMLNVAALTFSPDLAEGTGYKIILCLYNPFAGNAQERTPEVRCWNFNKQNVDENLIDMEIFQRQRITNLQQFPLKISIFEYEMKSVAVYDASGNISHYTYADGEVISTIAKIMNFTPVYKSILNQPKYGFQTPKGEFVGNLGDLEYGRVDLMANPMLIQNYNTTKSGFLQPMTIFKLVFIVKKRFEYKKILKTVFTQLDTLSLTISTSIFLLLPPIYLFIYTTELRVLKIKRKADSVKTLLYVLALESCVSMKHSMMTASRITVAVILFNTLMGSAILQGNLVMELNSERNIGRIKKIDQLIEQDFSVGMEHGLTYSFQEESDNKVSRMLKKYSGNLTRASYNSHEAIDLLKKDNKFAYLWGSEMTGSYLNNFYDNVTGENEFETVPESPFEFYLAMMVPKSSPFIDRINELINFYVETGLYHYHTKVASDDNDKIWINRIKSNFIPKRSERFLKMDDINDIFIVYVGLNLFCCLVFISEVIFNFFKTRFACKSPEKFQYLE